MTFQHSLANLSLQTQRISMKKVEQKIKSWQKKVQVLSPAEQKATKGGIMVIIEDVVM